MRAIEIIFDAFLTKVQDKHKKKNKVITLFNLFKGGQVPLNLDMNSQNRE